MATSTPPGSRTELGDVLTVLDLAGSARVWIDGGWGVDALLGRQTRDHGDLDLAIEARHLDAFVSTLAHQGFTAAGEGGATAWNFLLAHPGGALSNGPATVVGMKRAAMTTTPESHPAR